jgi:hypothetical protein
MIYTTFKQWAKGRFLEKGEPRKQAYSKDELALIEMGWNYGHDAGVQWQKSQQALDKKAENARELGLDYKPEQRSVSEQLGEPVAWRELCRRLYVELFHCNAQMTYGSRPKWKAGKEVLDVLADAKTALDDTTPQQPSTIIRTWVGLDPEEIRKTDHHMVDGAYHYSFKQGAEWAEAKLKEKNSA